MNYQPRVVDSTVKRLLHIAGAVLIEGPRACGKTATGMHHSESSVRLDLDDAARQMAELTPALVLNGTTPRLVDEWQIVPSLWNHVRHAVDTRGAPGQFLLAGSAVPADDATRHSGAGRILRLRMRPMTLHESGASSGTVSLASLIAGEPVAPTASPLDVRGAAEEICRGGWPGMQRLSPMDAQELLRSYLDDVARVDLPRLGETRRDPARVGRFLAAYARHIATPAALTTITRDTGDGSPLSRDAATDYLAALQRIMVVEEQPSWGPHLRSRDLVRKGTVRHFVDPSLAVAALGASPDRLLHDPNTLGLLFESLAIRDLRVYAQALDGEVRHYRDSSGTEADAIIQLRDGRWAAVEVKLGANQVDAAAASLDRLVDKIDTHRAGDPAARIIITGGEYGYSRPDGIHVVPLACLAP